MAYPYLPGSGSEAFKGATVLFGLMATLGGSNLFGQAASGVILMYSRMLRVGEYVRIGEEEGTVTELGTKANPDRGCAQSRIVVASAHARSARKMRRQRAKSLT